MSLQQFKLPDVGEGLTEADILAWRVAVGDTVEVNQIVIEVETAKAAVELPSPWAGTVTELLVAEGETVDVGKPIITIDTGGEAAPADVTPSIASAHEDMVPTPADPHEAPPTIESPARQPVLVGYGPAAEGATARRRRRSNGTPSAQTAFNVPPAPPAAPAAPAVPEPEPTPAPAPARHALSAKVLAKPPVRKLAKTLGIDLGSIEPTGPNGTVSRADVEAAADTSPAPAAAAAPARAPGERETRIPIKGVRKHTAAAMVSSAFTAPHVTEFITCDVTATMELRDRVAARRDFRDLKLSPLVFLARAILIAAKNTPEINSYWDDAAGEIVLKHYVNLGIAAATERGLIVPNIKDADQLSLRELAVAISSLTDVARSGKTTPADMSGGTLTITNVGVFGVDTGTPILNPGESAIVAFGAVRRQPWVVDGDRIEPRWITQLAVSFDHRLIDGAQGSQFLSDVAGILTDPGLALL